MPIPIYIRTETPLHIGSGREISPFEYIVIGQKYYRLNEAKVFSKIAENHMDFGNKLNQWIEDKNQELEDTKDNKKQSQLRADFNLISFIKNELGDVSLVNHIKTNILDFAKYSMPCQDMAGKKTFREQLKTAQNELYISGSSIKGVVKTALLYDAIKRTKFKKRVKEIIDESIKYGKDNGKGISNQLEDLFLGCGVLDNENQIKYNDAKYSLMKLISFVDTNGKSTEIEGKTANIDLYVINKSHQSQTPLVEVIKENCIFETRFKVDISFLLTAKRLLKDPQNIRFGKTEWIDIKENFEFLFKISLDELSLENAANFERQVWQHIANCLCNFGKMVVKNERRWVDKDTLESSEKRELQNLFYKQLITNETCSKIGWASGFRSTTIFTILQEDDFYKDTIEKLLKKFKIGVPFKKKNEKLSIDKIEPNTITIYSANLPTSRRFETTQEQINPLGWVSWHLEKPEPKKIIDVFEEEADMLKKQREEAQLVEPQYLENFKKDQKRIDARITEIGEKVVKVKLYILGYENMEINCVGVNPNAYQVGQLILVDINEIDKKTKQIKSVNNPKLPK